jgi:hypothetical protein
VLGVVLLTAASLVIAVGLALPATWHVERSVVVDATPAQVHRYVESLPAWRLWTPWNDATTPDARWAYGGPSTGPGAWMSWSGEATGRGSLRVRESDPESGVTFDEVIDAELVNATGTITYARVGTKTRVTWTDDGRLPAVFGPYLRSARQEELETFMEAGLRNLKALVESQVAPPAATTTKNVAPREPARGTSL